MLRLFRKRAKVILWCIIFGVGIPFILWGTGASRRGLASREYIGEIYGRKVSGAEFFREKHALRILALLRGERTQEQNIDGAVWNRIMLLEEAKRMGLTVSSGEIAKAIGNIPAFMTGGRFSGETFTWILNNWRISPADFELMVADSLLISKLQMLIMSTVLISDGEVRDIYSVDHEKVSIRYALFHPVEIPEDIEADEKELLSYYADSEGEFRAPERVSLAYIVIDAGTPEKITAPAAEEIERFYRDNPERFRHGKRVKARQIFIESPPEGDKGSINKFESRLRHIKARIEKGTDFAKLAKKYSDDKETAPQGGDLGYVEAGRLEEKLSEAAFSLDAGGVEGPVATEAGQYFIMVEDTQDPGIREIGEVRDEIAGILQKEREIRAAEEADDRASRKALSLSLALIDNPDLAVQAAENGLSLERAGPFSKDELPDGLPQQVAEEAFGMAVNEISDPVSLPGSEYAILTVVKRDEERIPPLSEIREKVMQSYTESLSRKKAGEEAGEIRGKVVQLMKKDDIDFGSACGKLGIETKVSPPFSIAGQVPGLGVSRDIASSAFSLLDGEPAPVAKTGKGFVLFAPEKRFEADPAPLDKNMEQLKQQYLFRKRQLEWLEWFRNAQARAAIKESSVPEEE